jgi:hypothetical protein
MTDGSLETSTGRKQRKRSPRPLKSIGYRPSAAKSAALKRRWENPEYRAEASAKLNEIRKPQPRLGVPDGMRKAQADAEWQKAGVLADRFIEIMKENEELPEVVIPGSEAEMAQEALKEAFRIAVGPQGVKDRIAAINTVLNFTKAKPESKSKLTVNKAEEWLAEIAIDMKKDNDGAE